MANVERANREFDQRAVFGLGEENQAEDLLNIDLDSASAAFGNAVIEENLPDLYPPASYSGFTDDPLVGVTRTEHGVLVHLTTDKESPGYTLAGDEPDESYAIHARVDYDRTEDWAVGGGLGFEGSYNVGVLSEANVINTPGNGENFTYAYAGRFMANVTAANGGSAYGIEMLSAARDGSGGDSVIVGGSFLAGVTGTSTVAATMTALEARVDFDAVGATADRVTGLYINNGSGNPSDITDSYGIFVQNFGSPVHAASTARAIYVHSGSNEFAQNFGTGDSVNLILKGAGAQTSNLLEARSSANGVYSTISENGYFTTRKTAAPADGELVAGEVAIWWDSTDGDGKFMIKGKTANGTVETASIPTA